MINRTIRSSPAAEEAPIKIGRFRLSSVLSIEGVTIYLASAALRDAILYSIICAFYFAKILLMKRMKLTPFS